MAKRSPRRMPGFVLRAGYVVPFDATDTEGMLAQLNNAIIMESLHALSAHQERTWDAVATEIVAEIEHLTDHMPANIARGLLIRLVSDVVFDRLRALAAELNLQPPTETIQ